jgi:hypothetical protein
VHIDSYEFGRIVIDGVTYTSDCLLLGDTVQADWWREHGHLLVPEDVQPVLACSPAILIIGCGASARMKVDPATLEVLRDKRINVEILDTRRAVDRVNELLREGADIAAALHLTC